MLTVAVSSRALFNLEDGHAIYQSQGPLAFDAYMHENEKKALRPGVAFSLVKKLLALNSPGLRDRVEVILLSSNTLEAGGRVMNSVREYGLNIERAFFTSGGDRFRIAKAAEVTLFLSTNPQEVRKALAAGIASASVMPHSRYDDDQDTAPAGTLCIAFDGDAVLFDDSAERVNQTEGLAAFKASERRQAAIPLGAGPFHQVLMSLHGIQQEFAQLGESCPLRVALVTARGVESYDRVLRTFRTWAVRIDEAFFCGGLAKGPFLAALNADLFFDDTMHNVESAVQYVPACHVPNGVVGSQQ